MKQHRLEWFKKRIGKKIYRDFFCSCKVCEEVEKNGLYIVDKLHAIYLFDCQNEFEIYYFDKPLKKELEKL